MTNCSFSSTWATCAADKSSMTSLFDSNSSFIQVEIIASFIKLSTITSTTCPDDKDATLITINKSVLTKHTAQGFSSSKPDDTKEEEIESSKMETCPTKNEQDSPSDDKTPTSSSSETVQATQEPSADQSRPDKKKNKLLGGKNSCCTIS